MDVSLKKEQRTWQITAGATTLLARAIGFLSEPLFRQLPWQQSKLVVLPHGLQAR
jgi:hypothetical protein